ncbi:MAG: hypothetical protein J6Q32_05940 [Clostridia bacterium]|nr:hypothetical protein [Clostridia bacterium]
MFIAKNNDLIILARETREELENDLALMVYTDIEETETNYELYNGQYLTEEEIAQKERERIGELQVTKRVFALALQQLGISYTQLKELIATSEQAQLEWDLCVELQRKNPLLDIMAAQLGVSSETLDMIFKRANGENE